MSCENEKKKNWKLTSYLISTSERAFGPAGTWTMWLLSLLFTEPRRASSFSGFPSSSSPKSTISMATLFFFSFLPIISNTFLSYFTGLKALTRNNEFQELENMWMKRHAKAKEFLPSSKDNDPLLLLFVLSMLKSQLSHLDTCG